MLRTIILLSPVFVSLFWVITLVGSSKNQSVPRKYLGIFMLFPFACFITHFLYFAPLHGIYIYADYIYQYTGSLMLPLYYIYFRLLTVDQKFSIKAHARYLAIPTLIATVYCIGAILTPTNEFRTWLFDEYAYPNSPYIQFLELMRNLQRLQFLIFAVLIVIGNFILFKKYGSRAEQFYSDINDGKYYNAKMLNYSIIIISGVTFIAVAIGRGLLMSKDTVIIIVWSIITIMIYLMGYMGFKQKPINPTYILDNQENILSQDETTLIDSQKRILQNILVQFDERKIYLNSQLNIMDVVRTVGTNRTYISNIINQQFNQNFCNFVNSYRVNELKQILVENPDFTIDMLSEKCGFGSAISLKRAVHSRTGKSLNEWKKQFQDKIQHPE